MSSDRPVYTVITFAPDPREWWADFSGEGQSFSRRIIGWLTVENVEGCRATMAAIIGPEGEAFPAVLARPEGWTMTVEGGSTPMPPGSWERP